GHSISNIKKLFSVMMELKSNQFRELVILKGIHDAFYNVNYAWAPLLLTLDSLCIVTQYPEHKIIGQNIADKVLSMTAGTVAPPFALPDKNGDTVKLASYRNQFVYLNFINTQAYPCQQQLELLQTLFHKHNQYFKIVSIVTDSDVLKAKLYIEKKAYSWDFLFTGGDMQVVDFYKVKAFPSYFLVEPNGLLLMSPAPDPLQGFEKTFFSIIKD
ncbi:MAG TPA: redoxin domain-containing protein, partial [Bacteroidales bacterium]|nr:redoxin domain-containing protein [Bacteroidales bacterium]